MADVAAEQALRIPVAGPSGFGAKDQLPCGAAIGFAALVAGSRAHGCSHTIVLSLPALFMLVGAILYIEHSTLYLGFAWRVWVLDVRDPAPRQLRGSLKPDQPMMRALIGGVAQLSSSSRKDQDARH